MDLLPSESLFEGMGLSPSVINDREMFRGMDGVLERAMQWVLKGILMEIFHGIVHNDTFIFGKFYKLKS